MSVANVRRFEFLATLRDGLLLELDEGLYFELHSELDRGLCGGLYTGLFVVFDDEIRNALRIKLGNRS